jgi:outer membrane beta-barrel protein
MDCVRRGLKLLPLLLLILVARPVLAEDVDKSLQPPPVDTDEITEVFKDMVVVQRKAKNKAHRFLFNTYGSFDFSDGPTTMYGLNLDVGYALSDFWELYANVVPSFYAQERDVVNRVNSLTLIDGDRAQIRYSKPLNQYGLNLLWLPAYGKDSWGPYSIIRSDTFMKLGAASIQYNTGESGMRFSLALGKTFFLSKFFNVRVSAGGSYLESIIDEKKKFFVVSIIETGLVWYF